MRQPPYRLLPTALSTLLVATFAALPNASAQAGNDLSTYAGIDAALQHRKLIELGETWRYMVGTEEPSPDLEWTKADFDDSGWSEGPSGFGLGEGDHATRLEGEFSTFYVRKTVEIPDPLVYRRIELRMPVEDGYVVYLNGREVSRLNGGKSGERIAFDGKATLKREFDELPVASANLTDRAVAGTNQIAVQILRADEEETMAAHPSVRGLHKRDAALARARYDGFRETLGGEGAEARLAYLEGRILQRRRKHDEAASHFLRAADLDPLARAPWKRLVECRRRAGGKTQLETELRERVLAGVHSPTLFDAWSRTLVLDLGRPASDLFAAVEGLELPQELLETGFFGDVLWGGRELAEGRALRVDCGANEDVALELADGTQLWSRDRFYTSGKSVEIDGDTTALARTARELVGDMGAVGAAYRIPVPTGAYELVLHFQQPGDGSPAPGELLLDVVVDGARVMAAYDPFANPAPEGLRIPLYSRSGSFEFDLVPRKQKRAELAAFEVRPLTPEAFRYLTRTRVEATDAKSAFALVQMSEAHALHDQETGAFAALEAASTLPGFREEDGRRLSELRDAQLPNVTSFATIDDLVARRPGEAPALAAQVRAAGHEELALYFEGRIEQLRGGIDEAIGAFEELVASGTTAPEPHMRMAECLRAAGLAPEADGLLRDALASGVKPTAAFLDYWIAINLDDLERDPWAMVEDLREIDVPHTLVTSPTSEDAARTWRYTPNEPPTTTWSRPSFNADSWNEGPGGIGAGVAFGAPSRSLWNTTVVFARRIFHTSGRKLLYPYVRVNGDDAAEVHLNGAIAFRADYRTDGYVMVPLRQGSFAAGENGLGVYGINIRGAGIVDLGIVQPIGDLVWIADQLDEKGAVRFNCGGPEYVAKDGTVWAADNFFGYGRVWEAPDGAENPEISGTEDDPLYQAQRWFLWLEGGGSAWYQVPLPDGAYEVTLHFAEIDPANETDGPRVIDILLETEKVFDGHDVAGEVGPNSALARTFETTVRDGWLDLEFKSQSGRAFLAGLEIKRPD